MTGYSTCGADINESSTEMFNLFPNPVNNMLQIKSNIAGMLNAEVFDFSGRMVLRKQVANESMDLSQLEAGMYLVKISNKEQSKTFRIIKK
jgi:hypothetical protein